MDKAAYLFDREPAVEWESWKAEFELEQQRKILEPEKESNQIVGNAFCYIKSSGMIRNGCY